MGEREEGGTTGACSSKARLLHALLQGKLLVLWTDRILTGSGSDKVQVQVCPCAACQHSPCPGLDGCFAGARVLAAAWIF